MPNWFYKNLGDATLAAPALDEVCALFDRLYADTKSSSVALYTRHESEGRLHCQLVLYCSPAASELAAALQAVTCREPSLQGLNLLKGQVD